MFRLIRGINSVVAAVLVLSIACDADNGPNGRGNPTVPEMSRAGCTGCLLRSRVEAAQPGDTIAISAGTYTMTGGELVIDKDLILVGAGPENTVIQASTSLDLASHRVVRITEGSVVSISGVTIRYGSEASTAARMIPFHSESVGLPSSGIEAISAEFGGGIYNQGTLTIVDSVITENFAGGGAGIFNGAKVTIRNSRVTANVTQGFGAGIFNGGILVALDTVIGGNTGGGGGGLSNWGEASLTGVSLDGNRSKINGGGFHNNSIGVMTLDSSTVSHNESAMAGGINNWGRLTVTNSTISENTANFAAGIDNRGVLTLTYSTVSGNTAREGGGLVVRMVVQNRGASISNTTIANTIIAGNTATRGPDCIGAVGSLGHNLVGVDSGCGLLAVDEDTMGTSVSPVDARLDALGSNGGPTATNALLAGSPAINASAPGTCPALDQRGSARPIGTSCDIGSYQR